MKKILLSIFVIMLTLPAFADEAETIKYMNQSQGFAGFNRTLPQKNSYKKLEKNTKFTTPVNEEETDFSKFDKDGWRIEEDDKPVNTEKKVIKSLKDSDGQPKPQSDRTPMTYDKFPQNYGNGDSIMMQNFMMPMGGMF